LGYPTIDPHGDPIPAKDGTLLAVKERALLAMQVGESAQITHLNDANSEMLRYAASLGLRPNTRLTLIEAEPFGGSLRVKIGRAEKSIGRELAAQIFVSRKA
jgi:DtxR family Mn-dependent transcriptional regulator